MNIEENQRVRLRRDVDRFPDFGAGAGMTGTVVWVAHDSTGNLVNVAVRMDQTISGAEEWNNEIHWEEFWIEDLSGDLEVIA